MQQLRGGREEHEKHLHDTIVKKTREFDKLRLEMETKLSEVSKSLSENRTQLIESQAENEALNHALKVSALFLFLQDSSLFCLPRICGHTELYVISRTV